VDLRKLRYFVSICETGSLSKASAKVSVAQSALSKHLAELEEELGTELVDRSPSGVKPTQGGRILLDHARAILLQVEGAKAAVRSHRYVPRGVVNLGLPESISAPLGLALLRAIKDKCPNVALHLHEGSCAALRTQLIDGHIDMAILFADQPLPGLSAMPLAIAKLFLISRRTRNRPITKDSTTLAAALSSPLILPGIEHGVRACIDAVAQEASLPFVNLVNETDSLTVIKRAVLEGMAMTILPTSAVMSELAQGQLRAREIVHPQVTCPVVLCSSTEKSTSPSVNCVQRLIASVSAESIASGQWPGVLAPTVEAA
jgi:LysR family transcriptional regulator, nitrogen assimilation regulatory protein